MIGSRRGFVLTYSPRFPLLVRIDLSMFRSHRSPYSFRQRKQSLHFWPTVLWVIVGLVGLELGMNVLVLLTSQRDRIINATGDNAEANQYKLAFLTPEGNSLTGIPQSGKLAAKSSVAVGYELFPEQTSEVWTINAQGFRDPEPVPLEKPEGEIRIFLLGGSTAFGQGIKDQASILTERLNARFQERLEQQQRSPEKYQPTVLPPTAEQRQRIAQLPPRLRSGNYRVINAAIPGYASGNQLAQLALRILPYNPDVIIVLNGYEDLMLDSSQESVGIPVKSNLLQQPFQYFWILVSHPIQRTIQNTMTAKVLQYYVFKDYPGLAERSLPVRDSGKTFDQYLPDSPDSEEMTRRVQRYRQHTLQMIRIAAGARVPLVVALQPEITGISPEKRTSEESTIVQDLEPNYTDLLTAGYAQLSASNDQLESAFPNNVKVLNYYDLFDSFSATAFLDTIHLTAAAHQAVSERFYNALADLPQLQQRPVEPVK